MLTFGSGLGTYEDRYGTVRCRACDYSHRRRKEGRKERSHTSAHYEMQGLPCSCKHVKESQWTEVEDEASSSSSPLPSSFLEAKNPKIRQAPVTPTYDAALRRTTNPSTNNQEVSTG